MGLAAWLNLEGIDIAALFAADLLGYLAGALMPPGPWALYTSILLSYHLFLAWLVFSGERKATISLPVISTILTHLACLAIVLPLGIARHYIPFFSILRYGITGLAVFERGWLFSANEVQFPIQPRDIPTAADSPVLQAASGDDFAEWQRYLAQQKPGTRKPGTSLRAEYEQWLLARQQARQAALTNTASSKHL